jgi:hypothetical protein
VSSEARRRGGEPAGASNEPAQDRAPAFALFDPFKHYGDPWLTPEQIAALDNPSEPKWPAPTLPPDEPVDAKSLCRRIRALANAMQDIEGQALRLARWRARRHLDTARPKRWTPLRVGQPPGWKRRSKTPIEEVLKDCHTLALDAWDTRAPPASVSKA